MSEPKFPPDPDRQPIADAASLFDSNVVHAYNPPPDPEPPSTAHNVAELGPSAEYGLEVSTPRAAPRPAVRPAPRPKPAAPNRQFDPTDDDDDDAPAVKGAASSRSDASIRVERASRHDVDAESDSSDRAPSRSKRRSSDRAIGFEDVEDQSPAVDEGTEDVDPVWTRGAEWGLDLARVAAVGVATLVVAYLAFGWSFTLALLVLAIGGAVSVLLSYPILISIERPIRITPEQAVNDFFAAASHHVPHYRRMWLLLSPTARDAARFHSFDEFRASWAKRMAGWKAGKGGTFTPLTFRVSEFRGDKSVGHASTHVDYTVQVFVRGQENDRPINTYRMMHGLVKGPDRMWYLNQGTLTSSR